MFGAKYSAAPYLVLRWLLNRSCGFVRFQGMIPHQSCNNLCGHLCQLCQLQCMQMSSLPSPTSNNLLQWGCQHQRGEATFKLWCLEVSQHFNLQSSTLLCFGGCMLTMSLLLVLLVYTWSGTFVSFVFAWFCFKRWACWRVGIFKNGSQRNVETTDSSDQRNSGRQDSTHVMFTFKQVCKTNA